MAKDGGVMMAGVWGVGAVMAGLAVVVGVAVEWAGVLVAADGFATLF